MPRRRSVKRLLPPSKSEARQTRLRRQELQDQRRLKRQQVSQWLQHQGQTEHKIGRNFRHFPIYERTQDEEDIYTSCLQPGTGRGFSLDSGTLKTPPGMREPMWPGWYRKVTNAWHFTSASRAIRAANHQEIRRLSLENHTRKLQEKFMMRAQHHGINLCEAHYRNMKANWTNYDAEPDDSDNNSEASHGQAPPDSSPWPRTPSPPARAPFNSPRTSPVRGRKQNDKRKRGRKDRTPASPVYRPVSPDLSTHGRDSSSSPPPPPPPARASTPRSLREGSAITHSHEEHELMSQSEIENWGTFLAENGGSGGSLHEAMVAELEQEMQRTGADRTSRTNQ